MQYHTSVGIIREIAEEGDTLWLASPSGLVKFNKRTYDYTIFSRANSGLPSVLITSIAVDRDGAKWIGANRGLERYDQTGWTTFDSTNSLFTSNTITRVIVDLDGNVWALSRNEVLIYNSDEGWKLCRKSGVHTFCAVAPGIVWAGRESGGVSRIYKDGMKSGPSGVKFDRLTHITHRDSVMWIVGVTNVDITKKNEDHHMQSKQKDRGLRPDLDIPQRKPLACKSDHGRQRGNGVGYQKP